MTPTEYLEENNNELKLKLEKNLLRNKVTKEMIDFAKEYHSQQLILSGVVSTLKCDCGNTEDVKNIPICASCYNPHTGEWQRFYYLQRTADKD